MDLNLVRTIDADEYIGFPKQVGSGIFIGKDKAYFHLSIPSFDLALLRKTDLYVYYITPEFSIESSSNRYKGAFKMFDFTKQDYTWETTGILVPYYEKEIHNEIISTNGNPIVAHSLHTGELLWQLDGKSPDLWQNKGYAQYNNIDAYQLLSYQDILIVPYRTSGLWMGVNRKTGEVIWTIEDGGRKGMIDEEGRLFSSGNYYHDYPYMIIDVKSGKIDFAASYGWIRRLKICQDNIQGACMDKDHIYYLFENSAIAAVNKWTGKCDFEYAIPGSQGMLSPSTPQIAGNRLYINDAGGNIHVLQIHK